MIPHISLLEEEEVNYYLSVVSYNVKCFLPGVLKSPNRSTWLSLLDEAEAFIGSRVGCGSGAERTSASSSIAVAVFGDVVTWDD